MAIKPAAFNINAEISKMYYNSRELYAYNTIFFNGCKNSIRKIIMKKNIPDCDYIFAIQMGGNWKISNIKCKKSILLISKDWVDNNFFISREQLDEINTESPTETNPVVIDTTSNISSNKVHEFEFLPNQILLNCDEKFRDESGNIIEIKTYGDKNLDNIYFNCNDVEIGFKIINLEECIINNKKQSIAQQIYFMNVDYKWFFNPIMNNNELYLTYTGLIKVLIMFNDKDITCIKKCIINNLFTIQLGCLDEKIKLGTNIINIHEKTFNSIFNSNLCKFPYFYLLKLGFVNILRESLEIDNIIPDTNTVYKYGFTYDLSDIMHENELIYKKSDISIVSCNMFDPKYTYDVELSVTNACEKYILHNQSNIIALDISDLDELCKNYKIFGVKYAGMSLELQNQVLRLKEYISNLNHEINVLNKTNNTLKTILESNEKLHVIELAKKDIEIENYKTQLKLLAEVLKHIKS